MENDTAEGEKQPTSKLSTKISYCPRMDLYRYWHVGEDDCFFDTPMLEKSIEAHMKNGNEQYASFMAQLTAFARKFPHSEVAFYESGEFKITKLSVKKPEEDGSPEGGGENEKTG